MDRRFTPTSSGSAEPTEEEFNRIVRWAHNYLPVEQQKQLTSSTKEHWTKLTRHDEKNAFPNAIKWRFRVRQASVSFQKAKDNDLMNAGKLIEDDNLAQIATKYLGLAMDQINRLNVFDVLKKWRDDKPYQGSKQVQYDYFLVFVCFTHSYFDLHFFLEILVLPFLTGFFLYFCNTGSKRHIESCN